MTKRRVEVFNAGCPVCEPAVQLAQDLACPDCEVSVYNLQEKGQDKARQYGLNTVPAVVVNGEIASWCDNRGPTRQELSAAGIGEPLSL